LENLLLLALTLLWEKERKMRRRRRREGGRRKRDLFQTLGIVGGTHPLLLRPPLPLNLLQELLLRLQRQRSEICMREIAPYD